MLLKTGHFEAIPSHGLVMSQFDVGARGENEDQSGNVAENRPLGSDTKPRIWFRLQSGRPYALVTFQVFERGRKYVAKFTKRHT